MVVNSLQDSISKILSDISIRREQLKEDYIKAWIAANIPDENLNADWIINNCQLEERWSNDRKTVTWKMVLIK